MFRPDVEYVVTSGRRRMNVKKIIIGIVVVAAFAALTLYFSLGDQPSELAKKQYDQAKALLSQPGRDGEATAKMINLFETSAKANYLPAVLALGDMYEHGKGTDQHLNNAVKYYRQAAEMGDVNTQFKVGSIYLENNDFHDIKKAAKYLTAAAEQNHIVAQYKLGTILIDGEGDLKNPMRAVQLFIKAANKNVLRAQVSLGAVYADGVSGIKPNPTLAYHWLLLAKKRGVPEKVFLVIQPRINRLEQDLSAEKRKNAEVWVEQWMKRHPSNEDPGKHAFDPPLAQFDKNKQSKKSAHSR